MHLLYCDETNFAKTPGDFFVYGGIVIEPASAAPLADEINAIRKKLGVPREYLLKFNPGPKDFSHEKFIQLKQEVTAAACKANCKLLVNLLLHDIATSSEEARRFGINTLCYHFDCYLNRPKAPGVVLIDRFDDKAINSQLKEKLAVGLTGHLPYGDELKLERVLGYHYTAIGQSHFCSLIDVVLGSLRFAVNAFTQDNKQHEKSAENMLSQLAPLFFRESGDKVHEISLWFSPKEIRKEAYREKYLALRKHLKAHGIAAAQAL